MIACMAFPVSAKNTSKQAPSSQSQTSSGSNLTQAMEVAHYPYPFSKNTRGRIIDFADDYDKFWEALKSEPNHFIHIEFYTNDSPAHRALGKQIDDDLIYANEGHVTFYRVLKNPSPSSMSTQPQFRKRIADGNDATVVLSARKRDGNWADIGDSHNINPTHYSPELFNDLAIHFTALAQTGSTQPANATTKQPASGIPGIPFSKSAQGRIIPVPDDYTTLRETLRSDPNPVVLLEFYSRGCVPCQRLERWIESDLRYANNGNISVYRILQEDSGAAISTREAYRAITQTGTPGVFLLAMDKDGDWAIVHEWSGVSKLSAEQFNSLATHFATRFSNGNPKNTPPEEVPVSSTRIWTRPK